MTDVIKAQAQKVYEARKAEMHEIIKTQARMVYETRQAKNAAMSKITLTKAGTPAWHEAVDVLRDAVSKMEFEEALLCSLVIEEQLGLFSV